MKPTTMKQGSLSGFSLIELSVVVSIMALLIGGVVAFATLDLEEERYNVTYERLEVIEEALEYFAEAFHKIPCPSNTNTNISDDPFGIESDAEGGTTCNLGYGGILENGTVYLGNVPVRTLQLPDEMAFDGWGRRFTYVMMGAGAETNSFTVGTLQNFNSTGDLQVDTIDGGTTSSGDCSDVNTMRSSSAMSAQKSKGAIVVIMSHGPNGHGAWPRQGTTRINAGVTDPNELENCACDSNGEDDSSLDNCFVQGELRIGDISDAQATTFDDIVYYKERWQFIPED